LQALEAKNELVVSLTRLKGDITMHERKQKLVLIERTTGSKIIYSCNFAMKKWKTKYR
jgi:hypothetical protein